MRIEVDYLSEVLLGDRLRIRTWTGEFRRTSMDMLQEARRDPREGEADSTLVARARVVAVWIGENGRSDPGFPTRSGTGSETSRRPNALRVQSRYRS